MSRKKEAQQKREFGRSNPLPSSREFSIDHGDDSSVSFSDDTNMQIIISSNQVPSQSHDDQTRSRGLNEMTPEALSSLKRQVCVYAQNDMWKQAQPIFDKYPDMVRIPLIDNTRDTALHVAVSANSVTFVEGLVKNLMMIPQDLENENFAVIQRCDGMLPVHLAALTGHHKIVHDLSSEFLVRKMTYEDIQRLFFMTISSSMFDVATKLFEKYPADLATARDDQEHRTALHILGQKPPEELYMKEDENEGAGVQLLQNLWHQVREMEFQNILELISEPSIVLFDAVKSGNIKAVKWILYMNRELLTIKDPYNGRNILHYAVLYRQNSIFFFILKMETVNLILRAVDYDRNSVLHLAAHQQDEASSSLRPYIQMQRELQWFQKVETEVPVELRKKRNKEGRTAIDVFYDEHKKLSEEIKGAAKGIAESGMLVATLVATVAFAAALTVPGDKTNAWFIVFILTNAVALFTSSASILSFLSNFTSSRFAQSQFVISLHPSLILGPTLLIISIAAMVIAFAAASFLIFDQTSKWVAYVVASIGVFPILLFLLFQFSHFDFLWFRYYRLS